MSKGLHGNTRRHSSDPVLLLEKPSEQIFQPSDFNFDRNIIAGSPDELPNSIDSDGGNSLQKLPTDIEMEDSDSDESYLKYNDILLKHILKEKKGNTELFKNSLNHISHMHSQMAEAEKEAKITSPKNNNFV